MRRNNTNDALFDAVLTAAAEEALRQKMDEMPSCEKLNKQYKPSLGLDKNIRKMIAKYRFRKSPCLNENCDKNCRLKHRN